MRTLILVLSLLLIGVTLVFAAQRMPLFEIFTSSTCGPCATANPLLDANYLAHEGEVAYIRYHMNWPAPGNDPFYAYNVSDNEARKNYYSITSVPTVKADGTVSPSYSPNQYPATTTTRLAVASYVGMTISLDVPGFIVVTMTPEDGLTFGRYTLQIALVEDSINYTGTNGVPQHDQVMRMMIPDAAGTTHNIADLTVISDTIAFTMDPLWDPTQLQIVAFLQQATGTTHPIANATKAHIPIPDYYFKMNPGTNFAVAARGEVGRMDATLLNRGASDDIFDLSIDTDSLPASWSVEYTVGGTVYTGPAEITSASRTELALGVNITVGAEGDAGVVFLTATSRGSSQSITLRFETRPPGGLLLVDDDQDSPDCDVYYTRILDALHVNYTHWDYAAAGAPSAEMLAGFPIVFWYTGQPYNDVLSLDDQDALSAYMDGGGKVILTGSEIGWGCGQPTPTPFYVDYLKADWLVDASHSRDISAIAGDEWFDGMAFSIAGPPEGINTQAYPDVIAPLRGALMVMDYADDPDSGAAQYIDEFDAFYFSFGLEGITTDAQRQDVISAVLNHYSSVRNTPNGPVPERLAVSNLQPNPATEGSSLMLLSRSTLPVTLEVRDVLGNLVASETRAVGTGTVRFAVGKDLVPGSYLILLRQGNEEAVRRLTVE